MSTNTLYEHGTLAMLMAGDMEGSITVADLLKHGDTGIGTLHGLNGEVIIVDGEVYQADETGTVNHITDSTTTLPFASVHYMESDKAIDFETCSFDVLTHKLVDLENLQNVFASVKLHGTFSHVKVRVAPKQFPPYPSLLEVTENQPVFETDNVTGTIIGYFSPELFGGLTAAGWHLHFLSDDRQFGGHILDFAGTNIKGELQIFENFEQHFPIANQAFRDHTVDLDTLKDDVAQSEGNND
ncbi:acetolactate decarboxylase [Periweissella cryptocerci]|uniref:Alpha-acetolactate decarboxylase n=1 Tax=Periweissella cryptocerci TaxID=2506420 RepID=A0A4P6YTS3_9LACO|nr:acetolactate decarboxylase [Periweissella cryptocerci]QBO36169.1 acetolactate decarboxylase [Periweissella cryptocerci]